ncbi:SubName: Full=Uncharacterized protein {ECO:0000313/EMBL:CCA72924.1} [Serendipita indica DSM 11827]|uniref:Uncharacterized protein n=1 Tax=Serendipita indica (strain DSM 11827) TaxID=1109443 RepID=G4TNN1_SERID|nr:SubName: Full=Uncharacterized protein {ECO:0000313/EMBL:CCA72924.1} [Serendipita indica DSM 11827]CCA72924.1 hypothetical protein PIIN_06860 [Serendipita indica DSM 11827]
MNTPLHDQTTAICLINASFIVGLVFDITAACLSFLTFRWLGRLTDKEKEYLNRKFEERDDPPETEDAASDGQPSATQTALPTASQVQGTEKTKMDPSTQGQTPARAGPPNNQPSGTRDTEANSCAGVSISLFERALVWWCSLSLFIPLLLIISGVGSMALGIQIYIWTLQKPLVAILVTLAYLAVIPFIVGLFVIGREPVRRERIMDKLAKRRGDW